MSELRKFLNKYTSNGHNTKDLFSVRRESNDGLKMVLKCLGMKDEGVLNNPGLDVILDNICYQISSFSSCEINFEEEHNRIRFTSKDGDKEFTAGLDIGYDTASYSYGYSYKDSDKNQCYYDFRVDCKSERLSEDLRFTEYSQYQIVDLSKGEKSYNSSFTTRLFDECGVEIKREVNECSGCLKQKDDRKLGFMHTGNFYRTVGVIRDHFDTAHVSVHSENENLQYFTVLNNEHGLQEMRLPSFIPDFIEPLRDEEIAEKIQHRNSRIVQKSLKKRIDDRNTHRYLNDTYGLKGTSRSRKN